MFIKFKDLEGIFKDLIPYQKRIKSLYRKIVELGYTGTEEEFVNFIYTEVTANLGKQDIKDKFKEIEDEIEKTIGNINKLGLNVLQKDNKTEYIPTENYNPATKKYVDDKIPRKLSEFENDLPNADYNQNDESHFDYIKNRPFYSIFKKIVTIDKQNITLDDTGYGNVIINDFEYNYEYSEQLCKFIVDNIEYEGKIFDNGYFGLCHSFNINENEEFYIHGNGSVSSSSNFAGNHTIEAIMIEEQIIPIENKYLQKNLEINNSISLCTRSGDIGDGSSTFGFYNEASGLSSFASGNGSIASNNCSHAEGSYAKAKGLFSHAEGDHTEATGKSSHAEGSYTVAKGESSHAEGYYTEASYYAHAQGKYNIKDSTGTYAHIVGNGTSDTARSNAHTLDWQGNAWYAGNVYTGGTGQDDENAKKLATEEFVNNSIAEVTKPKDYFILKDNINKYNYVIQMQNGSLVSFIKTADIKVTTPPAKTDYTDTEEFDPTGMVVVAVGEDGSEREITDYTYDKYVTTESNTHTIKYIDEAGTEYITEVSIVTRTIEEALVDFNYTANSDGTYTITGWKGTRNGVASTEMVFPNSNLVIL